MSLAARILPRRLAWQLYTSRPLATGQRQLLRGPDPLTARCLHASASALRNRTPSAIAQRLPDPERQPQRFRDFDLEGRVFVVTGGGRGLGLTLAEVLVEAGGKGRYSQHLPAAPLRV